MRKSVISERIVVSFPRFCRRHGGRKDRNAESVRILRIEEKRRDLRQSRIFLAPWEMANGTAISAESTLNARIIVTHAKKVGKFGPESQSRDATDMSNQIGETA